MAVFGRRRSVIAEANERISIVTVCQMLGVELPDEVGGERSRKVHCPFGGVYHSDQGVSPAMRIYPDSNSAWCFSCSAYYTPVSLSAQAWDCNRSTAAARLLERIGHRPLDLVAAFRHAQDYHEPPDVASLADALKTYCRRTVGDWGVRQFDGDVAVTLTRCLSLLDLVVDDDAALLWLARCKEAMQRALNSGDPSLRQPGRL